MFEWLIFVQKLTPIFTPERKVRFAAEAFISKELDRLEKIFFLVVECLPMVRVIRVQSQVESYQRL